MVAKARQVYFTKYIVNISVLSLQDNTQITPRDILLTEQVFSFVNIVALDERCSAIISITTPVAPECILFHLTFEYLEYVIFCTFFLQMYSPQHTLSPHFQVFGVCNILHFLPTDVQSTAQIRATSWFFFYQSALTVHLKFAAVPQTQSCCLCLPGDIPAHYYKNC